MKRKLLGFSLLGLLALSLTATPVFSKSLNKKVELSIQAPTQAKRNKLKKNFEEPMENWRQNAVTRTGNRGKATFDAKSELDFIVSGTVFSTKKRDLPCEYVSELSDANLDMVGQAISEVKYANIGGAKASRKVFQEIVMRKGSGPEYEEAVVKMFKTDIVLESDFHAVPALYRKTINSDFVKTGSKLSAYFNAIEGPESSEDYQALVDILDDCMKYRRLMKAGDVLSPTYKAVKDNGPSFFDPSKFGGSVEPLKAATRVSFEYLDAGLTDEIYIYSMSLDNIPPEDLVYIYYYCGQCDMIKSSYHKAIEKFEAIRKLELNDFYSALATFRIGEAHEFMLNSLHAGIYYMDVVKGFSQYNSLAERAQRSLDLLISSKALDNLDGVISLLKSREDMQLTMNQKEAVEVAK